MCEKWALFCRSYKLSFLSKVVKNHRQHIHPVLIDTKVLVVITNWKTDKACLFTRWGQISSITWAVNFYLTPDSTFPLDLTWQTQQVSYRGTRYLSQVDLFWPLSFRFRVGHLNVFSIDLWLFCLSLALVLAVPTDFPFHIEHSVLLLIFKSMSNRVQLKLCLVVAAIL